MTENEDIKIKREKKLRSRMKKRTTELIACYSDAPVELINTYRSLIEHLAFIDVMLQEYQDDMLINGFQVKYKNGKNQYGMKRNESVDLFKKWYTDRLSDSERLKKLLALENKDVDDGFDEFFKKFN